MTASTKAALLVGFSIGVALLFAFSDLVSNAKYNARAVSCKANFRVIALAMQTYQGSHGGKMPPTLKALLPIIGSKGVFICPLSGTETTPSYHQVAYEYRFLGKPNGTDVICWDSRLHLPEHSMFVFLNHPNRNVLLADGQVVNMQEAEFQKLHLSGQSWVLP